MAKAYTYDADGDDTFGIRWMGEIEDDAYLSVIVTADAPSQNNVRRGAYISYKVYGPDYPLQLTLPEAASCQWSQIKVGKLSE